MSLSSAISRQASAEAQSALEPAMLLIEGRRRDGVRFRPSDWAQRLANAAARIDARGRIRYHPHVRVVIAPSGSAVAVDSALADADPALYRFFRNFAVQHDLVWSECGYGG